MGMFDTIKYICPNCGTETSSQTKLGVCMLESLKIGNKFLSGDKKIKLKNPCHNCGEYAVMSIKDGEIISFGEKPFDFSEELWGETKK